MKPALVGIFSPPISLDYGLARIKTRDLPRDLQCIENEFAIDVTSKIFAGKVY
jgi:hypothetical protein